MRKAEFKADERWADRGNAMLEAPAQRVELLALAPRTKVRVRHLGGELNGLEAAGDARTQALVGRETVADRSALEKKD